MKKIFVLSSLVLSFAFGVCSLRLFASSKTVTMTLHIEEVLPTFTITGGIGGNYPDRSQIDIGEGILGFADVDANFVITQANNAKFERPLGYAMKLSVKVNPFSNSNYTSPSQIQVKDVLPHGNPHCLVEVSSSPDSGCDVTYRLFYDGHQVHSGLRIGTFRCTWMKDLLFPPNQIFTSSVTITCSAL